MKLWRPVLILGIGALALLTGLGTADAHSQLLSSDPTTGSVLAAAPTSVVLTFNEALLEETVAIAISDSSGAVVSGTVASAAGAVVTVPWPVGLGPDTYTVSYRVVSADGHPVTGSIAFTYSAIGATPASAPTTAAPAAPEPPSNFPVGVVGLVLALAATIAVIILARRGRR